MKQFVSCPLGNYLKKMFRFRLPTGIEIVFQILTALMLLGIGFEFIQAYSAFDCRDPTRPAGTNCYPWGMTEGPLEGGSWNYMNKEFYLKSSFFWIVCLTAMIAAPFVTKGPWQALGAVVVIGLFGVYAAEWVVSLV